MLPARSTRATNTAGVTAKDRTSTGPRPDGGASGVEVPSTGVFPIGGIIMWAGTLASIPTGWALCDGNNDTPDLTDRFILGTATEGEIGDTGGAATHSHGVGTLAVAAHSTATAQGAGSQPVVTSATHSLSGDTEEVDGRPPFYKLAFIQRIS
jgi:hypothetical protein